jgi:hypothetical protein
MPGLPARGASMPASVAGRGDAAQQSTVLTPKSLPYGRILWLAGCSRWSCGGPVEGEPFEVGFGEAERFSTFANDEERPCNKNWSSVSCLASFNRRGDRRLDLMTNAKRGGIACDEVRIGGARRVSARDDEVGNEWLKDHQEGACIFVGAHPQDNCSAGATH